MYFYFFLSHLWLLKMKRVEQPCQSSIWAEKIVETDWLSTPAPLTHMRQGALTGWIYGMLNV